MRYDIWRFYSDDRPKEYIKTVPDLIRAQKHCSDPKTHGIGWFDGYSEHDPEAVKLALENKKLDQS